MISRLYRYMEKVRESQKIHDDENLLARRIRIISIKESTKNAT